MGTARILITGVGGFVGHHLAHLLAERGDLALGLGPDTAPPATSRMLTGQWQADVCDLPVLEAALGEAAPAAIIHLAAQSSAAHSFHDPVETYRVNAMGTFSLLEAARRAAPQARVLVVGTGEVYGPQAHGTRVQEDAPIRPVSPYALSKAAADAVAEHYGRQGLHVVRTRSFGHLGPGQTTRFAVPSWCRQIAKIEAGGSEPILRVGNLDVIRDLTDVRDVAEAYVRLIEQGRPGAAYNVCTGAGTRLAAVVESLRQRSRVSIRVETDPALVRATDVSYLVGDPTRIQRETGWKAAIPLERTLDDTLEEWRSHVKLKGVH